MRFNVALNGAQSRSAYATPFGDRRCIARCTQSNRDEIA